MLPVSSLTPDSVKLDTIDEQFTGLGHDQSLSIPLGSLPPLAQHPHYISSGCINDIDHPSLQQAIAVLLMRSTTLIVLYELIAIRFAEGELLPAHQDHDGCPMVEERGVG
jgi:hypothetical protein